MAVRIPLELVTYNRRICNLYKRWLRNLEATYIERHEFRFEACVARQKFDQLLHEKDMIRGKQMIEDMEEELYQNLHPYQLYYPEAPRGTAFERYQDPPDSIVDFWHPLEKSIYPKYFAKRELRKQQYVESWEKHYGSKNKNQETKK